jgi:hypothetical protein
MRRVPPGRYRPSAPQARRSFIVSGAGHILRAERHVKRRGMRNAIEDGKASIEGWPTIAMGEQCVPCISRFILRLEEGATGLMQA